MLLLNEKLKVTFCMAIWAVACHSELELLTVLLGSNTFYCYRIAYWSSFIVIRTYGPCWPLFRY